MHYYRLYENIPSRSALGFGLNGARWNRHGTPLIYTANSVALAMMEMYSIKGPAVSDSQWVLATLEISGNIPSLSIKSLPSDWNKRPHSDATKNFGSFWAGGKRSPALIVPSARIPLSGYPEEHNVLINPLHPEFNAVVKVISEETIAFQVN